MIAEEAADLQQELARLQEESEAVVQLLEQRESELEQKTTSLMQLTADRDQTEKSLIAANASRSEAQALLEQDRERISSLEQLLELRQAEHATALEQELHPLRARVVELEELLELREAEHEHATALERELHSLRARVVEFEELESRRAATSPQPRGHLRLVARPTGYALSESAEPPPRVGELIGIESRQYAVASSGRSPLPGDQRPCVLLLAEPTQTGPLHTPDDVEPAADPLASL